MNFRTLIKEINNYIINKNNFTFDNFKESTSHIINQYSPNQIRESFNSSLENINNCDEYIYLLGQTANNIDNFLKINGNHSLEILHNNIKYAKYCSEYMVDKNMPFDERIKIFQNYCDLYVEYNGVNENSIKDDIQRLLKILYIPMQNRGVDGSKFGLSLRFDCSYSGKKKEERTTTDVKKKQYNSKALECKYYMLIYIPICPNMNKILKRKPPNDTFTSEQKKIVFSYYYHSESCCHNHDMSFQYVIEKNSFLTHEEREKLKEEYSTQMNSASVRSVENLPGVKSRLIARLFKESHGVKEMENKFLKQIGINDDGYIICGNKYSDGSIESIVFINEKVMNEMYSRCIWWIDDSVGLTEYNTPVFGVAVKDYFGHTQILSVAIMHDKSELSFDNVLSLINKCCNFSPRIICLDRDRAQINAVKRNFSSSKLIHCWLHILRNIEQNYGKNSPLADMFKKTMRFQIDENVFLDCLIFLVDKFGNNNSVDESDNSEVDTVGFSINFEHEIDTEFDDELLDNETTIGNNENNFTELIGKVKNMDIKGKIGCIKLLIDEQDNWKPSVCVEYGLYKDNTTNRIESYWGVLKKKTFNKKIPICELYKYVRSTSLNKLKNGYFVDEMKCFERIDQKKIKPLVQLIILEQLDLRNKNYDKTGSKCMSCRIRKKNEDIAYPCVHWIDKTFGNEDVVFDKLPKICFVENKNDQILNIEDLLKFQKFNLEIPNGSIERNGIRYSPRDHNTNFRPRNNVDFRIRKRQLSDFSVFKKEYLKSHKYNNNDEDEVIEVSIPNTLNNALPRRINKRKHDKTLYIHKEYSYIPNYNNFRNDDFHEIIPENEIGNLSKTNHNDMNEINGDDSLSHQNGFINPINNSIEVCSSDNSIEMEEENVFDESTNTTLPLFENDTISTFFKEKSKENQIINFNDLKPKENYSLSNVDILNIFKNNEISENQRIEEARQSFQLNENHTKVFFPVLNGNRWMMIVFCRKYTNRDKVLKNIIISIGTKKLQDQFIKLINKMFDLNNIKVKGYHDVKITYFDECFKKLEIFHSFVSLLLKNEFNSSENIMNILSEIQNNLNEDD